jgi:NAD/NADP transhydrogenase beta subunit
MTSLIIFFGLLVFLAGAIIVVNPEIIFGYLRNNLENVWLHVLAIGIRVVLGILLIHYAGQSRYPTIIQMLGWLSLAAAAAFAVIGRRRFLRLMSWAFALLKPYGRVGGLVAIAFGGFLVHAFL